MATETIPIKEGYIPCPIKKPVPIPCDNPEEIPIYKPMPIPA